MEAIAKYDFKATADDELSFKRGEVLKIISIPLFGGPSPLGIHRWQFVKGLSRVSGSDCVVHQHAPAGVPVSCFIHVNERPRTREQAVVVVVVGASVLKELKPTNPDMNPLDRLTRFRQHTPSVEAQEPGPALAQNTVVSWERIHPKAELCHSAHWDEAHKYEASRGWSSSFCLGSSPAARANLGQEDPSES
ncbi:unnamed protein product [Boreogadus saida]